MQCSLLSSRETTHWAETDHFLQVLFFPVKKKKKIDDRKKGTLFFTLELNKQRQGPLCVATNEEQKNKIPELQ